MNKTDCVDYLRSVDPNAYSEDYEGLTDFHWYEPKANPADGCWHCVVAYNSVTHLFDGSYWGLDENGLDNTYTYASVEKWKTFHEAVEWCRLGLSQQNMGE